MLNIADFILGRDSFPLPITAFQTLVKCVGGSGKGKPTSSSFTSMGSLIFSSSLSSADVGSADVAGNGGNGDGNGNSTGIVFYLFFNAFAFFFSFFLGGCKITGAGID